MCQNSADPNAECWQKLRALTGVRLGLGSLGPWALGKEAARHHEQLRIQRMQSYLWQFLVLSFAGWISRSQQDAIEYLEEENRALREQLGESRIRFTND